MQCRGIIVWSVYFYFNTLFCQNKFFPEGMVGKGGGVQNSTRNSGGVGVILEVKK